MFLNSFKPVASEEFIQISFVYTFHNPLSTLVLHLKMACAKCWNIMLKWEVVDFGSQVVTRTWVRGWLVMCCVRLLCGQCQHGVLNTAAVSPCAEGQSFPQTTFFSISDVESEVYLGKNDTHDN